VRQHFARLVTFVATSAVVVGFMAAAPAAAHGAAPMARISSNYARVSRPAVLPRGARLAGAARRSQTISGEVALAPRNPAALTKAAEAVSNPRSKTYHHYLGKGKFAAAYGPTRAMIDAVEATLKTSHLKVTSLSGNHLLVRFSGSIGDAEDAFRTQVSNVRLASGRMALATTKAVSFPASLASDVTAVVGLNTMVEPRSNLERATHPATVKAIGHHFTHPTGAANPCSDATSTAGAYGGLTDDQIVHSYGADGLYGVGDFGAGQTVGIYELEPFSLSDLTTFDTCYFNAGEAATMTSHVSVKNVDGGPGTGSGGGESILDIENVSAVAPGANIEVYQAPNGVAGPLDDYDQMVQDDTANIISTSWGECEALAQSSEPGVVNVENELFQQAALQGQSVFASAGDSGSDDCAEEAPNPVTPTLSVDDPTSQPFVTSVGGTTTTNAQEPPTQQVWNDGNLGGGTGGGVSSTWGAPSWQQPFLDTQAAADAVADGLPPCAESPSNGALCREVPDVTAQADEYTGGITIYIAAFGGWTTIGGTSSAAPLWAAMTALINASSGCQSSGNIGFASPSLYAVASVPADYSASFSDLGTGQGNNDVYSLSNGQNYATRTGYDMASGLGTPVLTGPTGQAGLASYLCSLAPASARPSITGLSPTSVAAGSPSGTLTISGSGFTGATGLSIGAYAVPSADWSVADDTTIHVTTIPTGAQALTGTLGPQDGTGRAFVSVTGSDGASSVGMDPDAELLYHKTASASDPTVEGVTSFGGSQAGGNTVAVFGSGFTGTTGVTFGGVAGTNVTVINDNELHVTVPAYDSGTTTCATAADPNTDVCQVQVVVTNGTGSSSTDTIRVPYTGAIFEGTIGGASLPSCVGADTCEVVPAETEYDYLPTPMITSVTTTSADDSTVWASEFGDTIATIDGSGFDSLGYLWTLVGNPASNDSQDFSTVSVSPTEIQVVIPAHNETLNPVLKSLSVQTLAGISASTQFKYAGQPKLTGLTPQGGPDLGGTQITATGAAFEGVAPADGGALLYTYLNFGVPTVQLSGYTADSDTQLTATTPQNNPGDFLVQVCTVTDCSFPNTEKAFNDSLFDFFEPGAPLVTKMSASSGPASGGTHLTITGQNLGDVLDVTFGKQDGIDPQNPFQILTNGNTTEIKVIVPPGKPNSTVHVRVVTAESFFTGSAPSAANAASAFTYKPSVASPPQEVTFTKHGTAVSVTWKAPYTDGGSPILHYRVIAVSQPNSFKKGAKKPPNVVVKTKHASTHSAVLTGLRGGWTYKIKVEAVTKKGDGLAGERGSDPYVFITDPA